MLVQNELQVLSISKNEIGIFSRAYKRICEIFGIALPILFLFTLCEKEEDFKLRLSTKQFQNFHPFHSEEGMAPRSTLWENSFSD